MKVDVVLPDDYLGDVMEILMQGVERLIVWKPGKEFMLLLHMFPC